MARSTAPPGPPPPHYRSPGEPAPPPPLMGRATGRTPADAPRPEGVRPAAVVAIALATLLLGAVVGYFAGREAHDGGPVSAPPLTSPPSSAPDRPGDTIPQQTPVDPSAPPSTDLDPTTIGTLDDPVPVGQAYILGLYEIEVLRVERDADQTLAEFAPANPEPPPGSRHLLVEVAIRFTDDRGLGNPASIPFFITDGTGRWSDIDADCGSVPRSILEAPLLGKDEATTGNACFTVPVDAAEGLVLGTEGFSGPLYFALPV